MCLLQFNFHQLVVEYDLLDFIIEQLLPAAADDDIVLQVITVIGTILSDEDCADQVARSGIVQNLMELLAARQEDDEMVLQIVFVFYKLLFYESSRKIIMSHPKTITYLIDLMYDKNAEIKRVCNGALTIVMQFDEEWAVKIRDRRFEVRRPFHQIRVSSLQVLSRVPLFFSSAPCFGHLLPGGCLR